MSNSPNLSQIIRTILASELGMPDDGPLLTAILQLIKNEVPADVDVTSVDNSILVTRGTTQTNLSIKLAGVQIAVSKTETGQWVVDATSILDAMSGIQADVDVIGGSLLPYLVKIQGTAPISVTGYGTVSSPYVISLSADKTTEVLLGQTDSKTTVHPSTVEDPVLTLTTTINDTTEASAKYYKTGKLHYLEFSPTEMKLNGYSVRLSVKIPSELQEVTSSLHNRCVHAAIIDKWENPTTLLYRVRVDKEVIAFYSVLPPDVEGPSVALLGFSINWLSS